MSPRRSAVAGAVGPLRRTLGKIPPLNETRMIAGFFPATTMPDADWWLALWPDPAKALIEMDLEVYQTVINAMTRVRGQPLGQSA